MGGGVWTSSAFANYISTTGLSTTASTIDGVTYRTISANYTVQDLYKSHALSEELNPFKVIRECCDSEEHPNTIPVIFALDVTGSMGGTAVKVAQQLNVIMTKLYEQIPDVEFAIMGIGDLAYDKAPIQLSQFESDIRIQEHLDKVYFEAGGGGNYYESYTAAWYMGLYHCKLDCWKRNKKGIIITLGDEPLNPYLGKDVLQRVTGDTLQADVETAPLYKEVIKKFDVYHIGVEDNGNCYSWHKPAIESSWGRILKDHFKVANLNNLTTMVSDIIINAAKSESLVGDGIAW